MKKLLFAALAALAMPFLASAQVTTITATQIHQGIGPLLSSGSLCLTPVNAQGTPTPFSVTGGGQYGSQAVCFAVTNGVLATGAQVPDALMSTPLIGYRAQVEDSNNNIISTFVQPIYPTGTTWSLDTWTPTLTASAPGNILSAYSTSPQGRCTAPSIAYSNSTIYTCFDSIWVAATGAISGGITGSGSTATYTTLSGTLTPGDSVTSDSAHNLVDAGGAPCLLSNCTFTALPILPSTTPTGQAAVSAAFLASQLSPVSTQAAAASAQAASVASTALPTTGGTMSGALYLSGAPVLANQAATKSYVDAAAALDLPLTGGTLSGALILPAAPTTANQAATKAYVDAATAAVAAGTGAAPAGSANSVQVNGGAGALAAVAGFTANSTTDTVGLPAVVNTGGISEQSYVDNVPRMVYDPLDPQYGYGGLANATPGAEQTAVMTAVMQKAECDMLLRGNTTGVTSAAEIIIPAYIPLQLNNTLLVYANERLTCSAQPYKGGCEVSHTGYVGPVISTAYGISFTCAGGSVTPNGTNAVIDHMTVDGSSSNAGELGIWINDFGAHAYANSIGTHTGFGGPAILQNGTDSHADDNYMQNANAYYWQLGNQNTTGNAVGALQMSCTDCWESGNEITDGASGNPGNHYLTGTLTGTATSSGNVITVVSGPSVASVPAGSTMTLLEGTASVPFTVVSSTSTTITVASSPGTITTPTTFYAAPNASAYIANAESLACIAVNGGNVHLSTDLLQLCNVGVNVSNMSSAVSILSERFDGMAGPAIINNSTTTITAPRLLYDCLDQINKSCAPVTFLGGANDSTVSGALYGGASGQFGASNIQELYLDNGAGANSWTGNFHLPGLTYGGANFFPEIYGGAGAVADISPAILTTSASGTIAPNINDYSAISFTATSPTTVVSFHGGVIGKEIKVLGGNSNVTILGNGTTITGQLSFRSCDLNPINLGTVNGVITFDIQENFIAQKCQNGGGSTTGGVTGAGTALVVPVYAGTSGASSALTNSPISISGSTVNVAGDVSSTDTSNPAGIAVTPNGVAPAATTGSPMWGVDATVTTAGDYLFPDSPPTSPGVWLGTPSGAVVRNTFLTPSALQSFLGATAYDPYGSATTAQTSAESAAAAALAAAIVTINGTSCTVNGANCAPASGSITTPGATTGYMPLFSTGGSSTAAIGNSPCDYGVTTTGNITCNVATTLGSSSLPTYSWYHPTAVPLIVPTTGVMISVPNTANMVQAHTLILPTGPPPTTGTAYNLIGTGGSGTTLDQVQLSWGAASANPVNSSTTGYLATYASSTNVGGVQYLPAANFPALTGDCTSTAGALATTCAALAHLASANTFTAANTFNYPVASGNAIQLSGTASLNVGANAEIVVAGTFNASGAASFSLPSLPSITVTGNSTALHFAGGGTAPTIAAAAGAGSSPTISLDAYAHDSAFTVTLTPGTSPTTGLQWTVTFNTSYGNSPHCSFDPIGSATTALGLTVNFNRTATTATMNATTALPAGTYTWDVICIK